MSDFDDLAVAVDNFAKTKIATTGLLTLAVNKFIAGSPITADDLYGIVSNFYTMTVQSNAIRSIMKKIRGTVLTDGNGDILTTG